MNGVIRGCPVRFERLAQKTRKRVYRLAFRLSGNQTDAEDLTQEAYLRAYKNFHNFHEERPFENWVLRIVSRLFLDLLRHRDRRVKPASLDASWGDAGETPAMEVADLAPTAESLLVDSELDERLTHALRQLSAEQRTLVVLADIEGVAYKEIAELFGAPVGTIRSRLHRTHRQLRKLLEVGTPKLSPSFALG